MPNIMMAATGSFVALLAASGARATPPAPVRKADANSRIGVNETKLRERCQAV